MSFSTTDRDNIMGYLGIPATEDQVLYVQGVLDTVELQADAEARIKDYLTTLASIDSQLATARNSGSAMPYVQLRQEGDRLVRVLSASLGITPMERIYA